MSRRCTRRSSRGGRSTIAFRRTGPAGRNDLAQLRGGPAAARSPLPWSHPYLGHTRPWSHPARPRADPPPLESRNDDAGGNESEVAILPGRQHGTKAETVFSKSLATKACLLRMQPTIRPSCFVSPRKTNTPAYVTSEKRHQLDFDGSSPGSTNAEPLNRRILLLISSTK